MITANYPNPNKPVSKLFPVAVGAHNPVISQSNAFDSLTEFYAKRKNISVEEYKRRDAIVKAEAQKVAYMKGDLVYPYRKKLYADKGMVKVLGIYRSYSDFETSDWPKDDHAFIITGQWVDNPNESLFCTGGYLSIQEPKE